MQVRCNGATCKREQNPTQCWLIAFCVFCIKVHLIVEFFGKTVCTVCVFWSVINWRLTAMFYTDTGISKQKLSHNISMPFTLWYFANSSWWCKIFYYCEMLSTLSELEAKEIERERKNITFMLMPIRIKDCILMVWTKAKSDWLTIMYDHEISNIIKIVTENRLKFLH